ncbi:transcription antitermination factor NusB [Lutibacter sp. TH_r2]|uniref:transcription antitermination factor NusB n=1 Tax=Lutibacter sp. TH_r2 TaxID=3082083 RepID=UPI0029546192|nr:transcription antitermination factor NusB [Lutibacter sp. TH_r2]MDV7188119.1 transcription antitermination factor NusB [Lutibacter sp. TH_r2]
MINRRHIRVKVMQSVYAMLQSKSDNLVKEEKFLYGSIDKMYDLYAILLQLLVEVRTLEKNHLELSKKKILATKEELSPNTKFVNNAVLKLLFESVSLSSYIEDHKLNCWYLDVDYVKDIWKQIKLSDAYEKYMQSEQSSFQEDKEFIASVFKTIIAPSDKLADYFEGQTLSWVDDIPFVNTWVLKTINKLKLGETFILGKLYKDEDDKKYVLDLFRKTVLNHTEFEKDIEDKTPNWDTERIAEIDMILIKMAICEFLKFPSIPSRVTINEFIEISKDYSTSKSSFFINGVLDKLLKEYESSKRINKIGRGLL